MGGQEDGKDLRGGGERETGLEYTVWKNLLSIKEEDSFKRLSNELTIIGSILGREMVVSQTLSKT